MKEKIFKLYQSNLEADQLIGRELFMKEFSDFIRERGKREIYDKKSVLTVSIEDFEECLEIKFERRGSSWSGVWFYEDELL